MNDVLTSLVRKLVKFESFFFGGVGGGGDGIDVLSGGMKSSKTSQAQCKTSR